MRKLYITYGNTQRIGLNLNLLKTTVELKLFKNHDLKQSQGRHAPGTLFP